MRINPMVIAAIASVVATGHALGVAFASAADLTAEEIMKRNFFVTKVASLSAEASMSLHSDNGGVRKRQMTVLSKLQDNGVDSRLVIRFGAPADIRGTTFMQVEHSAADDDLWIYLPALKKSRRLVANNKKDSFVGSDFAYGDILPPRVEHYRHELVRSDRIDGRDFYVIKSVPKNEAVRHTSGYASKITPARTHTALHARTGH